MSLTNDQITAQNFKTFYEGIRPYLNGSFPTPIANKFSKGDLYSTDEKLIGQWIDGKPLYQKVIESETTDLTTSYRKYGSVGVTNISVKSFEYTIYNGVENKFYGQTSRSNSGTSYGYIDGSSGDFYLKLDEAWSSVSHKIIAIVQYTKITDDPIEIGSDTDYSTTEKIVGTWIDGKPVYQKVIEFASSTSATSGNTWINSGVDISEMNIDSVIEAYAYTSDHAAQGYPCIASLDGSYLKFMHFRSTNIQFSKICIKYVKTTD